MVSWMEGSVTSKIDHLWKTNRPHHPHHNQSKVATDAAQLHEMVHQEDNARVEARVFSTRPPDHNCARPTDRQTGADADEQRRYVLPSFLPVTSSYSLSAIAHRARLHNPPNQPTPLGSFGRMLAPESPLARERREVKAGHAERDSGQGPNRRTPSENEYSCLNSNGLICLGYPS